MSQELIERTIRERLVTFAKGDRRFEAYHVPPARDAPGLVVDENRWVLSEMFRQGHRSGAPIKRAAHKQRRRPKRVGVFDTLSECRVHITTPEKDTP